MLLRNLRITSTKMCRNFGGGKEYDPKYERDWNSKQGKMIYNLFMREYDASDEVRKKSWSDRNPTVQSCLVKYLNAKQKSNLLRAAAQNFDTRKNDRTVLRELNPPKIHENSVNVYFGGQLANEFVNYRSLDWIWVFPFFCFALPSHVVPIMLTGYFATTRAWIWEPIRRLVLRMDLLPHLEAVSMTKVGHFGILYNEIVRLEDLQKMDKDKEFWKATGIWNFTGHDHLDGYMIYTNKKTGEYYCFEENGMWDWNGVNHPLIR